MAYKSLVILDENYFTLRNSEILSNHCYNTDNKQTTPNNVKFTNEEEIRNHNSCLDSNLRGWHAKKGSEILIF